jgi:hypothetical protein
MMFLSTVRLYLTSEILHSVLFLPHTENFETAASAILPGPNVAECPFRKPPAVAALFCGIFNQYYKMAITLLFVIMLYCIVNYSPPFHMYNLLKEREPCSTVLNEQTNSLPYYTICCSEIAEQLTTYTVLGKVEDGGLVIHIFFTFTVRFGKQRY